VRSESTGVKRAEAVALIYLCINYMYAYMNFCLETHDCEHSFHPIDSRSTPRYVFFSPGSNFRIARD
jgi:hypothetical protein